MNLQVPDELISAYFDGEVTPDERAEVERLLESSTELRQQLDETSKLSALLHSFPRESAPRDLTANVQKRVDAAALPTSTPLSSPQLKNWRREWTAFGAGILATMASLLAMMTLYESPLFPKSDHNRESLRTAQTTHSLPQAEAESLGRFTKMVLNDAPSEPAEDPVALKRMAAPAMPLSGATSTLSELAADSTVAVQDASGGSSGAQAKEKLNYVEKPESVDGVLADNGSERSPLQTNFFNENNQGDLNANSIQSQTQDEFLWSISNGDVVVSKIADPSNTVAVVDLTVVDIDRGADQLKVLLQKRSVQQVNESNGSPTRRRLETMQLADQKKSLEKSDTPETARSDEFEVFYVRAPGDQLASMIDDLMKNHPDLYRNWTPQPPIELPVSATSTAETLASTKDANNPAPAVDKLNEQQRGAVEDPKEVNVEADLAVNYLVARNSLMTTNGDRTSPYQGNSLGITNGVFDVRAEVTRKAERGPSPADSPDRDNVQPVTENLANATTDQSYFRVSRENMPQLGLQLLSPGQNANLPALDNRMQYQNANTAAKSRQVLANNYDRSSKLVRMLIVLKSDQPAAANSP